MSTMMRQSDTVAYTHSDFLSSPTSSEESIGVRKAIANVARTSGKYSEEGVRIGIAVAKATYIERGIRISHQYRLGLALGQVGLRYPRLDAGDPIIEKSFANFAELCQKLPQDAWQKFRVLGGKGLASELGQVEQFGSWVDVEKLDTAVYALDSQFFTDTKVELVKEYDYHGEGKIDYKTRVVDTDGRFITIERARPTRDFVTDQGDEIHQVKGSLFIFDTEQATREQRDMIRETLHSKACERKDIRRQLGEEVVEPFIVDPAFRDSDFKLFPVSALHYVLARHRV